MRVSICYSSVALASATVRISTAFTPIGIPSFNLPKTSALFALPNSASGPWVSRGVLSKTAREGALNVEWEPMSEMERRIEDGIHYEHLRSPVSHRQQTSKQAMPPQDDGIPCTRGVFVGYRYTKDEYDRLKSADPSQ